VPNDDPARSEEWHAMVSYRPAALVRAAAIGLAGLVLLSGCSGLKKDIDKINRESSSTGGLESFIQQQLTQMHRSVRSVDCKPYVDEVLPGDKASETCVVRFTDGSSYTTPATISDPGAGGDPDVSTNNFSFNDPPALDITKAPLPRPKVTLAATSRQSFFVARNLSVLVRQLTARFGQHDLIISMAIYPGEIEAVIAADGGRAWAVSDTYAGVMTVGPRVPFYGSRNGIGFSQLVPAAIAKLSKEITARGGVRLADIDRFVLTNSLPDDNSGWNIYLRSGTTRFRALVSGSDLVEITPSGSRRLA
jgi:hypothetical protein